jgi:hypothetical protein
MTLYRVTTRFVGVAVTGGGINRLYFESGGGTAQQALTAAGTFWNAVRPVMSDSVTWTTDPVVDTLNIITGNIEAQTTGTGSSFAGTTSAALQPLATQGILQIRTGQFVDGREVRGRIFIPGVTSTAVSGGAPTAAYKTALTTPGNTLIADGVSAFGIYHRPVYDADHNLVRNGSFHLATVCTSPSIFAVLRSRRD